MKQRITITLSEDLLDKIDETIDHHTTRNRSQAIESVLRQTLKPRLQTAVILAGGGGTRLWPKSRKKTPKHLLKLFGEKSLLKLKIILIFI